MSGTPFTLTQFAHLGGHVQRATAKVCDALPADFVPSRLMRAIDSESGSFQAELECAVGKVVMDFYRRGLNRDPSILRVQGRDEIQRNLDRILLNAVRETRTGWGLLTRHESPEFFEIDLSEVELVKAKIEDAPVYPTLKVLCGKFEKHCKGTPLGLAAWSKLQFWYQEQGFQDRFPKKWIHSPRSILFPGDIVFLGEEYYMPEVECSGMVIRWRLKPLGEIANPNTTRFVVLP